MGMVSLISYQVITMNQRVTRLLQGAEALSNLTTELQSIVTKPNLCKVNLAGLAIPQDNTNALPITAYNQSNVGSKGGVIAKASDNYFGVKVDKLNIRAVGGEKGVYLAKIEVESSLPAVGYTFRRLEFPVYVKGDVVGSSFVVSECADDKISTQLAALQTCPSDQMIAGINDDNSLKCTAAPPGPPGPPGPDGDNGTVPGADGDSGVTCADLTFKCVDPNTGLFDPTKTAVCSSTGWKCI